MLSRKRSAFTLIEILVVIIIMAILISISMANYIGAQIKAKLVTVKENMHACQVASESYATDSDGLFAGTAADLGPFYPGGGGTPGSSGGNFPTNPFSNVNNETPVDNGVSDVQGARAGAVASRQQGQTGYAPIAVAGQNTSYSITGYDNAGVALIGPRAGTCMVLSNQ